MRRTQKGLATLLILAASHSMNAQCIGDLNEDLAVDLHDLLMLLIHYGDSCSEEATTYPTLHISEIHYNPNSAQGNDSDWEFLELYNPMDIPVPLEGWRLDNAVAYQFDTGDTIPALGFFAIARNLDSMLLMLPSGANCAQWNSGESLNNTGETIELWSPDEVINQAVAYEDNDGWVSQPDGQGPSLEWMDTGLENGAVDSWTYSLVLGGTPGAANSMWGLTDPE